MTGVTSYVTGQVYTPYGEPTLTTRNIAGGVYTQDAVEYDTVTRRVSRTTVKPETSTGTVSDRHYDYDAVGNIISIRETPQVGPADNQCFRYDALRRLTSAWTPSTGGDCAADPAVATLGGPAPYWTDWTFDAIGNRRKQVTHTAAGDVTQTATVPDSGPTSVRPHGVSQTVTTAPGQAPVTRAYGYDRTGNTTSRPGPAGASQALTWDAEGKVATAVEGTAKVSNVYDADGERLVRRDPTGTTVYLPGMELRRQNDTTVCTRYYNFAGKIVAQRTQAGGLVWLYSDHQGTQQITVHALTQKASIRRQTPYGEPRGEQSAWPNGKGFVGGDTDPTGLTHLGAREYDAALGRFISVDPVMNLTDPQQWNAYTYANGNPTTHSDPSGKCIPEYCNAQTKRELKTDPHTGHWKPKYTFNYPFVPRRDDDNGNKGGGSNKPGGGSNSGAKPKKKDSCGSWSWLCSAGRQVGHFVYEHRAQLAGAAVAVGCIVGGVATVGGVMALCIGGAVAAGATYQAAGDALNDKPVTVSTVLGGGWDGFEGATAVFFVRGIAAPKPPAPPVGPAQPRVILPRQTGPSGPIYGTDGRVLIP